MNDASTTGERVLGQPRRAAEWGRYTDQRIDFLLSLGGAQQTDDPEFWRWYDRFTARRIRAVIRPIRGLLATAGLVKKQIMTREWVRTNTELLWQTRQSLADDVSRSQFDTSIAIRVVGPRKLAVPRLYFDDMASVSSIADFDDTDVCDTNFQGHMRVFDLTLNNEEAACSHVRVACHATFVRWLNTYCQYFARRGPTRFGPRAGDIAIDCGACLGDFSTVFAGMVGPSGQMHAFDPLPLHIRFCEAQRRLNPDLANSMHFNAFAVGATSSTATSPSPGTTAINPGLRASTDAFDFISLDDYVKRQGLNRVDFIKMDIEGGEMDALAGAADTIRTFKPRLAICGYHKPPDLWEIPQKIHSLNPGYQLAFGHHSPVEWESVFYAIQPD